MVKKEIEAKDVYELIDKQNTVLGEIKTQLNVQNDNYDKNQTMQNQNFRLLIIAVLAMSGSTVGLKITGTPALDILMIFVSGIIALFIFIVSVYYSKDLPYWYFSATFGLLYSAGLLSGCISKYYEYQEDFLYSCRLVIYIVALLNLFFFFWLHILYHIKLKNGWINGKDLNNSKGKDVV